MSTTFQFIEPGARRPASPVLPAVRATLRRTGLRVWSALEAYGHARARHEMLEIAHRMAYSSPELAAEIRRSVADAPR